MCTGNTVPIENGNVALKRKVKVKSVQVCKPSVLVLTAEEILSQVRVRDRHFKIPLGGALPRKKLQRRTKKTAKRAARAEAKSRARVDVAGAGGEDEGRIHLVANHKLNRKGGGGAW